MMIELFEFKSGETTYRYTSTTVDVEHNGHTWAAVAIGRGSIQSDQNQGKTTLGLEVPHDHEIAMLYRQIPPDNQVTLRVYRLHQGTATPLWSGAVAGVSWSGDQATIECRTSLSEADGVKTRARYQANCRHALYGRGCGVNPAVFTVNGAIQAISDDGLIVTSSDLEAQSPAWYVGGTVEARGQVRTILPMAPEEDGKVRISRPIDGLTVGDSFSARAGCDHSVEHCRDKFSNLENFGGFTLLPDHNPFERSMRLRSK